MSEQDSYRVPRVGRMENGGFDGAKAERLEGGGGSFSLPKFV
jgi:hypothetical protein